jgi:hypothetical protein
MSRDSFYSQFNVKPPPSPSFSVKELKDDLQCLKDQLLFIQSLLLMNPSLIGNSRAPELIKIQEKIKQIDNKIQKYGFR